MSNPGSLPISEFPTASYEGARHPARNIEEQAGLLAVNSSPPTGLDDNSVGCRSHERRDPESMLAHDGTYGTFPGQHSSTAAQAGHFEHTALLGTLEMSLPAPIPNKGLEIVADISGSLLETPGTSHPHTMASDLPGTNFVEEVAILLRFGLPILVSNLLERSLSVVSVITLGHRSTMELAAGALGYMTATVTGYSILIGMVSALDSLLPQAWGGPDSHKKLVGLWTLRMGVVLSVTLVPILVLWQWSYPLLLLLHQDPEIARYASLFLSWFSLGMPAYTCNILARRYYTSMGLTRIPTLVIVIVAPLNALLNYVLVWGPGPFKAIQLGFIGAPIASTLSFNIMTLIYAIHVVMYAPRESWYPITGINQMFSAKALGLLLRLGVSGVGQVASEWWSWELTVLAASLLGPVALASQSILLVSASTAWQCPCSMAMAASVRVGHLLGSGEPNHARIVARLSLFLVVASTMFNSTLFLVFRNSWAFLFNEDVYVAKMVAHIMPLLAVFGAVDGLTSITMGLMRVVGKQDAGALLNVVGYYIIGIPLGLLLTFYFTHLHLGLLGLWLGLSSALVVIASVGMTIVLQIDWALEAEKISHRLEVGITN